MSKVGDANQQPQLIEEYVRLKDKIIGGTITQAETRELYDAYSKVASRINYATIEHNLKDLNSTISSEKLHDFVGKLLEVEKQIVDEMHSKSAGDVTIKKSSDFLRNHSLAKNALLMECKNNEFGKKEYEILKKLDSDKTIEALVDISIPPFLQEHYSLIKSYYSEIGNPEGANVNFVFHTLNTSITGHIANEFKSGAEITKFNSELKVCSRAAFDQKSPASMDVISQQIDRGTTEGIDKNQLKNNAIDRYIQTALEKERQPKLEDLQSSLKDKQQEKKVESQKKAPSKTFGQRFDELKSKVSNQIGKIGKTEKSDTKKETNDKSTEGLKEKKVVFKNALLTSKQKLEQEKYPKTNIIDSSKNSNVKSPPITSQQKQEEKPKTTPWKSAKPQELQPYEKRTRPGPLTSQDLETLKKQNVKLAEQVKTIKNGVNEASNRPRANAVSKGSQKWVPGKKPSGQVPSL